METRDFSRVRIHKHIVFYKELGHEIDNEKQKEIDILAIGEIPEWNYFHEIMKVNKLNKQTIFGHFGKVDDAVCQIRNIIAVYEGLHLRDALVTTIHMMKYVIEMGRNSEGKRVISRISKLTARKYNSDNMFGYEQQLLAEYNNECDRYEVYNRDCSIPEDGETKTSEMLQDRSEIREEVAVESKHMINQKYYLMNRKNKDEAQLKAGFIVMKSSLTMLVTSLILFLIIRYL